MLYEVYFRTRKVSSSYPDSSFADQRCCMAVQEHGIRYLDNLVGGWDAWMCGWLFAFKFLNIGDLEALLMRKSADSSNHTTVHCFGGIK